MDDTDNIDEHAPLFVISIAAELSELHPQTLRHYDRLGLVRPGRTPGKSRRYSLRDIARLREVTRLGNEGISLPGIQRILTLEDKISELTATVRHLEEALAQEMINRPGSRVFAAAQTGDVISILRGTRVRHTKQIVVWNPNQQ